MEEKVKLFARHMRSTLRNHFPNHKIGLRLEKEDKNCDCYNFYCDNNIANIRVHFTLKYFKTGSITLDVYLIDKNETMVLGENFVFATNKLECYFQKEKEEIAPLYRFFSTELEQFIQTKFRLEYLLKGKNFFKNRIKEDDLEQYLR